MALLFLDANIFLYAIGGEGPHRSPCRDLLAAVGAGTIDAVTSTEVLQEILHVRLRRAAVEETVAAVKAAADLVSEVLPVARDDVLDACDLVRRAPGLDARDAIHAAVMLNHAIHLVASVDPAFDAIPKMRRLSPADALALAR